MWLDASIAISIISIVSQEVVAYSFLTTANLHMFFPSVQAYGLGSLVAEINISTPD